MNYRSENIHRQWIASEEEQNPSVFPELYNLSGAFMYQFLPRPKELARPEFLFLPSPKRGTNNPRVAEFAGVIGQWNIAWEAGQLRSKIVFSNKERRKIFKTLPALSSADDRNVYLLPDTAKRFDAYLPLYSLLPLHILERFGLPAVRKMIWPTIAPINSYEIEPFLPTDFRDRLSKAFAIHIWPFIEGGSSIKSFGKDEPIRLLAHNLDFWLPNAVRVAERRLASFDRVAIESDSIQAKLAKIRAALTEDDEVQVDTCRMGGSIWQGEAEAHEATEELVQAADGGYQLRSLVDAIRSNRVEEDFSDRWSYAREDFERKLYRKRSRIRVKFVELKEADGIVGPQSEVSERILWQDFFALLDSKERQIVVCLAKGPTNLTEAAQVLGYSNHTPISKALKKIRLKAQKLLED
jgi:hypothetical protein